MMALARVHDAGAVGKAQLGAHVAAGILAPLVEGARFAEFGLEREPAFEERPKDRLPVSQQSRTDVATQPLARVLNPPGPGHRVFVDVVWNRTSDARQPAAKVVQQAEAETALRLSPQWR